ncbi:hypothetical protein [Dongia sp.]|uniref:hypothetical protein n=1 Tax=Dongia sp. TaxID=1977262 RepID=UPI0035B0FC80
MLQESFETGSLTMLPVLLVTVLTPPEDAEYLLKIVTGLTPLVMGRYDSNAFQGAGGIEFYRPLEGAAAGPETAVRARPGMVELTFELPEDPRLLSRVVETIFQHHAYQEPNIRVAPILSSRSKGLDDKANPRRWWNRGGDWAKVQS